MGQKKHAYNILVGKPEEEKPPEDLGVDARLLKLIFKPLAPSNIHV